MAGRQTRLGLPGGTVRRPRPAARRPRTRGPAVRRRLCRMGVADDGAGLARRGQTADTACRGRDRPRGESRGGRQAGRFCVTAAYAPDRLRSRLRDVHLGRVFRVIHRDYGSSPLRAVPAPSRFSDPGGGYAVVYASEAVRCAFWETLGRNRFARRRPRELPRTEVEARLVVSIRSSGPLALIDLRADGPIRIGAPSAAAHDGNCAAGAREPAGSRDEARRGRSPEACRASRCPGTPAPPASRGAGIAGDRCCSCRWRRIRGPGRGRSRGGGFRVWLASGRASW